MVRLTRIYTRGGDRGKTSLGNGRRVSKGHPRVVACGVVDELNATLGLVLAQTRLSRQDRVLLQRIQNDLFDVGADLCVPVAKRESVAKRKEKNERLRVTAAYVTDLEKAIDKRNEKLEPLESFVMPGGSLQSAWMHMARTVCRRAESCVALLIEKDSVHTNKETLRYLNRLSDLLFVMARGSNANGRKDILWQPGGGPR